MEEELARETKSIREIPPLKKGRRILAFLADYFIVFILALLLNNVGVYRLGRIVVDYEGQMNSLHIEQEGRDSVLYGHNLLYAKEEKKTYDRFDTNLEYTCTTFIRYYIFPEEVELENVFEHYFVDIRNNRDAYLSLYREIDEKTGFFEFDGTDFDLKDTYKEEFFPYYNPGDTMSFKASSDFTSFQDKFFARAYQRVLADVYEKDLVFEGISYKEKQSNIQKILQNGTNLVVFSAVISYAIVWLLFMMVIPTFSKKHRTIGLIVMRIERFRKKDMREISLPSAYLGSAYFLLGGISAILFVPWGITAFNELFSLPVLFPLALISIAYMLGSLALLLFDPYNRTLSDFFLQSLLLDERDLDAAAAIEGGSTWTKKE